MSDNRVTFFINSLRSGGAERVCVTLANELRRLGWQVELLVLNLHAATLLSALDESVAVTDLNVQHARNSVREVISYLKERRPSLFMVFNHQLAILLVVLRSLGFYEGVIVARNISFLSLKAQFQTSLWHRHVVHWLTLVLYRKVDLVIAQSEAMKRDLLDNFGLHEDRVKVVPNPLAPAFQQGCAMAWSARRHELLYVGRLEEIKGLDLLIEACAICFRGDETLKLRIVGEGAMKHRLLGKIQALGMEGRVTFEGLVANPISFYRRAKVLLLTSHYEGFPNVLLEALSQGTPIVSVDCLSGPSEIVEEHVNGFLVSGRDPDLFGSTIRRALAANWDTRAIQQSAARYFSPEIAREYAGLLAAPK